MRPHISHSSKNIDYKKSSKSVDDQLLLLEERIEAEQWVVLESQENIDKDLSMLHKEIAMQPWGEQQRHWFILESKIKTFAKVKNLRKENSFAWKLLWEKHKRLTDNQITFDDSLLTRKLKVKKTRNVEEVSLQEKELIADSVWKSVDQLNNDDISRHDDLVILIEAIDEYEQNWFTKQDIADQLSSEFEWSSVTEVNQAISAILSEDWTVLTITLGAQETLYFEYEFAPYTYENFTEHENIYLDDEKLNKIYNHEPLVILNFIEEEVEAYENDFDFDAYPIDSLIKFQGLSPIDQRSIPWFKKKQKAIKKLIRLRREKKIDSDTETKTQKVFDERILSVSNLISSESEQEGDTQIFSINQVSYDVWNTALKYGLTIQLPWVTSSLSILQDKNLQGEEIVSIDLSQDIRRSLPWYDPKTLTKVKSSDTISFDRMWRQQATLKKVGDLLYYPTWSLETWRTLSDSQQNVIEITDQLCSEMSSDQLEKFLDFLDTDQFKYFLTQSTLHIEWMDQQDRNANNLFWVFKVFLSRKERNSEILQSPKDVEIISAMDRLKDFQDIFHPLHEWESHTDERELQAIDPLCTLMTDMDGNVYVNQPNEELLS